MSFKYQCPHCRDKTCLIAETREKVPDETMFLVECPKIGKKLAIMAEDLHIKAELEKRGIRVNMKII